MTDHHGHHEHRIPEGEEPRWPDKPENVKKIIWFVVAICTASVVADLFYDKHGHYDFEHIIGFHAAYGFVSCVVLVLAATQMRKLVMRDEDYYGD